MSEMRGESTEIGICNLRWDLIRWNCETEGVTEEEVRLKNFYTHRTRKRNEAVPQVVVYYVEQ